MNKGRGSIALFTLAVAQLILALDYTIVFVALPSIQTHLHFTPNNLQWVVSAYALTYGGLLLIGGRLADLIGARKIFVLAMVLFGFGSLLGGLSASPGMLIAARSLQGIGGAFLSPATLSLIMSNFTEESLRNRALAILGGDGWRRSVFGTFTRRNPNELRKLASDIFRECTNNDWFNDIGSISDSQRPCSASHSQS